MAKLTGVYVDENGDVINLANTKLRHQLDEVNGKKYVLRIGAGGEVEGQFFWHSSERALRRYLNQPVEVKKCPKS